MSLFDVVLAAVFLAGAGAVLVIVGIGCWLVVLFDPRHEFDEKSDRTDWTG